MNILKDTNLSSSRNDFLPSDHISFEAESHIRKMIKPLDKLGNINYFCYGENYPDGSCFTLHSNAKYYESWFTGKGTLFGFYLDNGWHLYDSLIPANIQKVAHSQDIGNCVIYVQKHKDKTIVFEFGTRPDNDNIHNFYRENSALLKRFGNYFYTNLAKDYIPIAKQQTIKPPSWMTEEVRSSINIRLFETSSTIDNPFNLLTHDEKLYLNYLLKGSLNNQIAKELNVSQKKISKILIKIRDKLECANNKELFEKARSAGIIIYDINNPVNNFEDISIYALFKDLYSPISILSKQEHNCYKLMLKGCTLSEISNNLSISIPTVSDYINRLKRKLKCSTKSQLFSQAIDNGFFQINL
jgi:DNA-binding CsgD family transcriptional regulator